MIEGSLTRRRKRFANRVRPCGERGENSGGVVQSTSRHPAQPFLILRVLLGSLPPGRLERRICKTQRSRPSKVAGNASLREDR